MTILTKKLYKKTKQHSEEFIMPRKDEFTFPPHHPHQNKVLSSFILALGLTLGGFFPAHFYYKTHIDNNSVTVKGLAEKDVIADLAIWRLKFVVTSNDLRAAQTQIATQSEAIKNFLKDQGFKSEEITTERTETNDLMANPYRGNEVNSSRFILTQSILIKTTNVNLVEQSVPQTDKLIAQGIVFDNNDGYSVSYIFTKLNDVKPEMLAEATRNAKKAAEEFAKNAGSSVGKIHRANQGVFSILPREQTAGSDESQHINKTIRVVSTVEYWLD